MEHISKININDLKKSLELLDQDIGWESIFSLIDAVENINFNEDKDSMYYHCPSITIRSNNTTVVIPGKDYLLPTLEGVITDGKRFEHVKNCLKFTLNWIIENYE